MMPFALSMVERGDTGGDPYIIDLLDLGANLTSNDGWRKVVRLIIDIVNSDDIRFI
jgi:hypothetical protein